MVLKSCKGTDCTKAWNVIHPDGSVKDLWGALNTKYDKFYMEEQERVEFSRCERGYILDAEGPQNVKVWSEMT
jgi:N-acetylglucosamine-6-sulfatase